MPMGGMKSSAIAVLCATFCCAAVSQGQTTNPVKPNPPPQICVNNQCVTTASPVVAPSSGAIKWNPGHYMASGTVLYGNNKMAKVQPEMDDLNNQDAMLGYRIWVTWGGLEPTQGNYDFSVIDAILARLKTAYNKPKRLVIGMWLYGQGAIGSNSSAVLPMYIQQNPIYGPSPVTGRFGWWGQSAGGASTGMYAPALYYPPVMDRFIAMVQALGHHLDGDPNVEGLYIQENATIAQAASAFPPVDPHYSDTAWLAQIQRLLTAATAAFPHTNVVMANSWFDRPPPGVALQQWMAANRIASGSADTWGQSGLTTYGTSHLSDGVQTLLGVSQYGGNTDLRKKMGVMVEVQSPDIVGNYFRAYGGPWTPLDLINAFNQTYYASHVFWTHMVGTETVYGGTVPAVAIWSNLAATCAANPLTHTSYPANYP
jgi:hypothetical protein